MMRNVDHDETSEARHEGKGSREDEVWGAGGLSKVEFFGLGFPYGEENRKRSVCPQVRVLFGK
jgi:hypothetical protein